MKTELSNTKTTLALPAPKTVLMPVGHITPDVIRKICNVERKREFEVEPTRGSCGVMESKSYPYRGRYRTYPKYTNVAYITSYACISDSMLTWHHAYRGTKVYRAPKGMRFAEDANGVKLVRESDGMDYHPTMSDWDAKDFASRVRKGMADNFKARAMQRKEAAKLAKSAKERAAREKLIARDLRNTRVSLDDSRKAGNCVEGTLAFAERKLGLSREEILSGGYMLTVSAAALAKRANGDSERVNAAILRAWMRETTVSI